MIQPRRLTRKAKIEQNSRNPRDRHLAPESERFGWDAIGFLFFYYALPRLSSFPFPYSFPILNSPLIIFYSFY